MERYHPYGLYPWYDGFESNLPIGIALWDKILYQPHGRVLGKGFGMIPEPMVLFQYKLGTGLWDKVSYQTYGMVLYIGIIPCGMAFWDSVWDDSRTYGIVPTYQLV